LQSLNAKAFLGFIYISIAGVYNEIDNLDSALFYAQQDYNLRKKQERILQH
jgi:hypothetical protein